VQDMVHTCHSAPLHCKALYCTALHSTALYIHVHTHNCAKPQDDKWHCSGVVCPVHCSAVWYVHCTECSAVKCSAVHYVNHAVQCSAVLWCGVSRLPACDYSRVTLLYHTMSLWPLLYHTMSLWPAVVWNIPKELG
jgi:hypothetical protein